VPVAWARLQGRPGCQARVPRERARVRAALGHPFAPRPLPLLAPRSKALADNDPALSREYAGFQPEQARAEGGGRERRLAAAAGAPLWM
jgi:hypothetical protein